MINSPAEPAQPDRLIYWTYIVRTRGWICNEIDTVGVTNFWKNLFSICEESKGSERISANEIFAQNLLWISYWKNCRQSCRINFRTNNNQRFKQVSRLDKKYRGFHKPPVCYENLPALTPDCCLICHSFSEIADHFEDLLKSQLQKNASIKISSMYIVHRSSTGCRYF